MNRFLRRDAAVSMIGPSCHEEQVSAMIDVLPAGCLASDGGGLLHVLDPVLCHHRIGKPDDGKFTLLVRRAAGGPWRIAADMDNGNHRR